MTTATKIALALAALLAIVLVVYYGSLSAGDAPELVMDDPPQVETEPETAPAPQPVPAPRVVERPAPARSLTPPQPEPTPNRSGPSRLLGESVELALSSERPTTDPVQQPRVLADRAPVPAVEPRVSDGGKDAPEFVGPPVPDDLGQPAQASEQPAASPTPAPPDAQPAPRPSPRQAAQPRLPQPPAYTEYTIKQGDTLSVIARDWFGDEAKWDLIAKANPLIDPSRLRIGQVLRLPPKDAQREDDAERVGSMPSAYVVRSGDNLSRIARIHYGDATKWQVIYDANRAVIGDSPNNLRVGMRLVIPPAPAPARASAD